MRAQPLTAHREVGLFPELRGFVLADPDLLEAFHSGRARGLDLLRLYSESEAGDRVASEGVAIPILGLEPAYYCVTLRSATEPSTIVGSPIGSSAGWVLRVASKELVLGGIGYLKCWDPNHPKLRKIAVSPGWYSVVISLGATSNGDDFALDLALTHCDERPEFTADLRATLC